MSFNRLTYDDCAYKSELNESVSYLGYMLDPIRYEHCQKCRPEIGIIGGTAVSHGKGNLVDLENNLFGIDRPNTHCPSYKWTPRSDGIVQGKEYIKPICHKPIDTTPIHLRSCQFADTLSVPQPPALNLFKCSQRESPKRER
jgi:hypothetical protein